MGKQSAGAVAVAVAAALEVAVAAAVAVAGAVAIAVAVAVAVAVAAVVDVAAVAAAAVAVVAWIGGRSSKIVWPPRTTRRLRRCGIYATPPRLSRRSPTPGHGVAYNLVVGF